MTPVIEGQSTEREKNSSADTLQTFWSWYERHYLMNVTVASGLFLLQLLHLYWLTTDVVFFRFFGESFFSPPPLWKYLIVIVDYTEIPALLSTSVLYLHEFRGGMKWKGMSFLFFLNSQWLHLVWITDEFVVGQLVGGQGSIAFPMWLAWIAIFIDYLELPVIADTFVKFSQSLYHRKLKIYLQRELGYNFWRR